MYRSLSGEAGLKLIVDLAACVSASPPKTYNTSDVAENEKNSLGIDGEFLADTAASIVHKRASGSKTYTSFSVPVFK